jgi:hypothetical protein
MGRIPREDAGCDSILRSVLHPSLTAPIDVCQDRPGITNHIHKCKAACLNLSVGDPAGIESALAVKRNSRISTVPQALVASASLSGTTVSQQERPVWL